ncbi:MAG TPA: hypothetical protein VK281_02550 [Xanthobacteraceae bacterium]|nr:hypothetical protein [Xanthobacteraceae bacterium]
MCFGMTQTGQTDTTRTMPSWLTGVAQGNIGNAQDIASQPYVGQQIAGFNPTEEQAFANVAGTANAANANNPYLSQIQQAYSTYGSAPASTVSAPSVLGANVNPATASLSQYIDPNLQMELSPTLQNIELQREQAVSGAGGVGSQATGQGGDDAFGDSRAGVSAAQTNNYAMLANAAATGQAYQNAFTNAANLRGIDLSNLIGTQTTNAGLQEQQLARVAGAGTDLQNLATGQTNQALTLDQALLGAGQLQQQQAQAAINLPWLNNQGLQQFELAGLAGENAATATATPAAGYSTTSSTYAPNNAGWALAGTLGGSILGGGAGAFGGQLGSSIFGSGGLPPVQNPGAYAGPVII